MTKLELLIQKTHRLSESQIDALITQADVFASVPTYYSAPQFVRDSIARGIADVEAGRVVDGETVFKNLRARILNAQAK
jgi:predicted transcriptional regulator